MNINLKNIKVVREYLQWRNDSGSAGPTTRNQIALSIDLYRRHTGDSDLSLFRPEHARSFKKMLQGKTNPITGKPITPRTQRHHLIHMSDFFKWLPLQPGYRSKLLATDYRLFHLDSRQNAIALNRPKRPIPTLEIMKKVATEMKVNTEIDRRDQAIIAGIAITGMRNQAVTSIPLGLVDIDNMLFIQDPVFMKTKFGRYLPTVIFDIDNELLQIIKNWVTFLREVKMFAHTDPLFPASMTVWDPNGSQEVASVELSRNYWKRTNGVREIFKKHFAEVGVPYYNPHSFRDAVIKIMERRCQSIADYKAVSQNIGHKKMSTTFYQYGDLTPDEVAERIRNLSKDKENPTDMLKQIRDGIEALTKNKRSRRAKQ